MSNLTLRSNVHVGTLTDLGPGGRLVSAVRGRTALQALLAKLDPGRSVRESCSVHLTPEQIAELWQDACSECRFFTVGPVATPCGPVLQVRCPQGGCQSSILPTKALLLDQPMVDAL